MSALCRIFYASRANAGCDAAAVNAILQASRRNNVRLDVTGCLLFSGAYFAQVVEGRSDVLHVLLSRIAVDRRHSGFRIFKEEHPSRREYGSWSMGYLYDLSLEDRLKHLVEHEDVREDEISSVMERMEPDTVMGALT